MSHQTSPDNSDQRPAPLTTAAERHASREEYWVANFEDPSLESRRLFAEALGTFMLVLAGAGSAVVDALSGGQVGRVASVSAPGLTVLAVILFMGAISGAHLNPVVSIAFAARGDFPWRRVPPYVLAQLIGATLAVTFLRVIFGRIGMLGATTPGAGISQLQAVLIETVLTTGLISTILGTASRAQNLGPISAIGVASYIILAGLWASPISGASMNPARSIAPAILLGDLSHLWIYITGPLTGALLAIGIARILRGPPGQDPHAAQAAQGH